MAAGGTTFQPIDATSSALMEQFFTRSSVLEAQQHHGIRFPQYTPVRGSDVKERLLLIAAKYHPGYGRSANPYILDGLATEVVTREQLQDHISREADASAWIGFQGLQEQYDLAAMDIPHFIECYWKAWPERAHHYGFYIGNARLTLIATSDSEREIRRIPNMPNESPVTSACGGR
ncbi:MAG: hypothetical protein GIKADHBN_03708 [Phycisphaerales bacterium]|nr:hypothetical protein [Phycisphaerales bacterium]